MALTNPKFVKQSGRLEILARVDVESLEYEGSLETELLHLGLQSFLLRLSTDREELTHIMEGKCFTSLLISMLITYKKISSQQHLEWCLTKQPSTTT